MDTRAPLKWIKTAGLAALGGGLSTTIAAMFDSSKYQIPRDFFSGKLWPYFFSGAGLTFGALLIHSPLGQKVMGAYRESQAELEQSRKDVEALKEELKPKDKRT